ncbi:hypothetical protein BS47DRAFT_1377147 [Hydnum rufescens UP504]|uniref:Peptidase M20 dimerisation domain-containing protein n=1 Tax=Hydnum rufescens UP504 TaxID=1448309 RepID=A0A9P6AVH4_9AGAM|nr:hypothetical protein BS47DRAFT_1377147 [Hydnum rufescens UP504]
MPSKDEPLLGHHAMLSSDGRAKTSPPTNRWLVFAVQFLCMTVGLWNVSGIASRIWAAPIVRVSRTTMCPQQNEIYPRSNLSVKLNDLYNSHGFRVRAVQWLSGAIKVPTESYDEMGPVGVDPRWGVFGELHEYLAVAFPKTHSTLRLTKVNTYALAYHWEGSDGSLKPILLAGHQDVVPVDPDTISAWPYPPYSGYYDGTFIWGRGSADDKSGLIGIFSAIETLIESGFTPRRSVVIASGIDEESAGYRGAGELAIYLEKTYGKDAFAMLVDEGGAITELGGLQVAKPDVAEKGYLDVKIQIATPGGHSTNPHEAHLKRTSPLYSTLLCAAEHAPDMDGHLKQELYKSVKSDRALKQVESIVFNSPDIGDIARALSTTTQAVDFIQGGIKVNALPELATAVVNHRIAIDSSVSELTTRLTQLLEPLAAKHRLDFVSFGRNVSVLPSQNARAFLSGALEPAPISPTDSAAYKLLSGTILATYKESFAGRAPNDRKMIVGPGLAGGNTDTQFYWNLTRNIFRYNHLSEDSFQAIHTVGEAIRATAFVDGIRFFSLLIMNADEAEEL